LVGGRGWEEEDEQINICLSFPICSPWTLLLGPNMEMHMEWGEEPNCREGRQLLEWDRGTWFIARVPGLTATAPTPFAGWPGQIP
jgi:hypothetical protein